MFKIGEFSKLSLAPVKTLRYYDEIGLLRPAFIDEFTSYRYYTIEQLPRLNRILALKDLGFSLEQVARLLDEGMSPAQMREILLMKRSEQEQRIREEQERLARVEWRLRQIEEEGVMATHEMIVKQVEPQLVAGVRGVVPTYPDIGRHFGEVYAYLAARNVSGGVCAAIYYDGEYRERDVDCEGIVFLDRPLPSTERVNVYELPGRLMACTVHHGGYSGLSGAYRELMDWIASSGYRIAGPERELYLRGPRVSGDQNDPDCITEIQFPVERIAG